MIKCHKCGASHPDNAKFCNKCGSSLEPEVKYYCPKCDAEVENKEAKFCLSCGTAFDENNKPIKDIEDYKKRVCGECGCVLKSKRAKFCNNCGNQFNEENKPLIWDDAHPLYRLCTYCGEAYNMAYFPVKCKICGHDLDLKPRTEPRLTVEEKKVVDDRINEEARQLAEKRRQEQEERVRIEKEAKEAEAKRQLELVRKRQRKNKIIKIILSTIGILIASAVIGAFVWHSFDDNNIAKAQEALAAGDYNSAIKYYGYVMPLGNTYKESKYKIDKITVAGQKYEKALDCYNKYSYVQAVQLSDEARKSCPELTIAGDLYNKSIESLGVYLKKQYDAKKYAEIYKIISNIDQNGRNQQINSIWTTLCNMIETNNAEAEKKYKAGYIDSALKYTEAALAISPDNYQAKIMKSDINSYKEYITNIESAISYYNNGDLDNAETYYEKIPDNTVGDKVKAKYPTFVNKITDDLEYKDDPVDISDKYGYGHYSVFHNNDDVEFSFTLTNRINRPVSVDVKFTYNNNEVEYNTYYLLPKESYRYTYTMYDIYLSPGNWTYNIALDGFEIQ